MPRSKSKGRDRTNDLQNKIKIRRQSRSKSPSKRQSSSFYHQIDSDGSGTISFNELCQALKSLSYKSPKGEVDWNDDVVWEMLDAADADGDGEINEAEFLNMMSKVESGALSLHANWYALSASAAEKTILNTHRDINLSFDETSQYFRNSLGSNDSTGTVNTVHRLLAVSFDLLFVLLTYGSCLLSATAYSGIDFNTLFYFLDLCGINKQETMAQADNILISALGEDLGDGVHVAVTCTISVVLLALALFALMNRGQTMGQMILSHQPIKKTTEVPINGMFAIFFIVISVITLDAVTGLGSSILGIDVVFRDADVVAKLEQEQEDLIQNKKKKQTRISNAGLSKNSLAKLIHQPLCQRPFSDPIWLLLYISLAVFVLYDGDQESSANGLITWLGSLSYIGPYTTALAMIPAVVLEHPGIVVTCIGVMTLSTVLLLKISELILRPLLYLTILSWTITVFYTVVTTPTMAMAMIPPLFALRYVYQYRASFELQISLYQEAIVATIAHPLLPLFVPMLEGAFYLFQVEMTTRLIGLEWTNWTTGIPNTNLYWRMQGMRIFIPWSLQFGNAYFEMMVASVMGRFYYRKASASSSSNSISRTFNGISGVLLKSPGTAIAFGFMGMLIGMLQRLHSKICVQYDKLSWWNLVHLLPKLMLCITKYIVAWIIFYFEAMHRNGISYAGMTGEGIMASINRAGTVMKTDGVLVLAEHSGTGKLSAFCVSMSATVASGIMYYFWSDIVTFVEGDSSVTGTSTGTSVAGKGLQGVCLMCMISMATSTIQVLSRASNTIMLCALDEMSHDAHTLRYAPERLKKNIKNYMNKKANFPSGFWSFFVMLLFTGACYGMEALRLKKEIDEQQQIIVLIISMVLAIIL